MDSEKKYLDDPVRQIEKQSAQIKKNSSPSSP